MVEKLIVLEVGQLFDFIVSPYVLSSEDVHSVSVDYPNLAKANEVGGDILEDNGLIRLDVIEKNDQRIRCGPQYKVEAVQCQSGLLQSSLVKPDVVCSQKIILLSKPSSKCDRSGRIIRFPNLSP